MIDRTAIKAALKQRRKNIRRHRWRAQVRMRNRDAAEVPKERKLLLKILDHGDVLALNTEPAPKYPRPDVHILLSLPAYVADELIAFGGQFEDDEDTDGGEDQQDMDPDDYSP